MEPSYLVFDLETVGHGLDVFDDVQKEYLLRGTTTDEEREKKIGEFALCPFTGRIVCIGMQMLTRVGDEWKAKRVAYSVDPTMDDGQPARQEVLPSGATWYLSSERTMLENFWKLMTHHRGITLVSFNGRNFDAPWLLLRSAVLGLRPSKNLMDGTKFNYSGHIDLIDRLTFFQGSASGATRRFNFDFYAKSFGITSPKSEGVDGSKVGVLFEAGNHDVIAEYCLRDVTATWDLFVKWDSLLRF
ncbi:MAG: ribonuclease H-like domain-containing protein [Candidatus Kapabacteria bacterium]|nr:ribonuclease H-like domain-containing protein [Candidatus Kapabacteria bacterium]